ncbi:MAG: zf-HC2 domain-containing protein [Nocardiopsaceae bacterium]|jgi:hypothetical protein|nr:zf-HC2 domain-containing protein [Nocardiopsaceae bacterium]
MTEHSGPESWQAGQHPDPATLAEFREGILSGPDTARIRSHLAGCPGCASASDRLGDVTALLANAPVPPVPPEVAARIQAAIAVEATARSAAAAAGVAGNGGSTQAAAAPAGAGQEGARAGRDGAQAAAAGAGRPPGRNATGAPPGRPGASPGRHGRRRSRVSLGRSRAAMRALAAAAVLVVLGGGGYGVAQLLSPGGPGQATASGTSARAAASRPSSPRPGGLENGGFHSAPRATPSAALPAVSSQENFTHDGLASQVRAAVKKYQGSPGSTIGPTAGGRPLGSMATLRRCVMAVTPGQAVRLIVVAKYQGKRAYVIVTAAPSSGPDRAVVVGDGCTPAHPDVLARTTVPGTG